MRIAIVNDLALAREVLRRAVLSVPGYSIAWVAENGADAVAQAARDVPDIVLMDLIMPVMDGVEATRQIMAGSPCPILLVTSSVTGNLNQVYAAMGHGGLDAVNTPVFGPGGEVREAEPMLARIAKLVRSKQISSLTPASADSAVVAGGSRPPQVDTGAVPPLVILGASTGGPEAVAQVLSALPADLPAAVVVVQHIGFDFAPGLAHWLATRTRMSVTVARAGEEPKVGTVALASTNDHLLLRSDKRFHYSSEPGAYPYRPSVDVFCQSAARHWTTPGVAALLTGMGSDGARGILLLKKAGWLTLAQDQGTSVVYGMPKAAVELQAVEQSLPLSKIGPEILGHVLATNRRAVR
ncbi:MAG TPA: chemotaxis-specific protein-glutamate methyltransferase CheB [Pirellulales bacterium]|jgi:two-component system response regulator WspF